MLFYLLIGLDTALVALLGLVTSYHLGLVVVRLVTKKPARSGQRSFTTPFAIVIPAHNEEKVIGRTLDSCLALDYPPELFQLFVVADNCDDQTAEVASASGALCLERHNLEERGKGYALSWAFNQILPMPFDAVLVLDADCSLERHALRVFAEEISRGHLVLQANNGASNPDESLTSYATTLANTIENELFYVPKTRLGLPVLLRGTGMVLHRKVLEDHPWKANSIVEDAEYSLCLIRAGICPRYVEDVRVTSVFPADQEQLKVQRSRWVGGALQIAWAKSLRCLCEGLKTWNLRLVDLGWTLLITVRSLVCMLALVTLSFTTLSVWLYPGMWSRLLLLLAAVFAVGLAAYLGIGILTLRLNGLRLKYLLCLPLVGVRMVAIALPSMLGRSPDQWQRTPRAAPMRQRVDVSLTPREDS